MFESVSGFFSAWRAVFHISAWTGLSLGALAAIAAVVWYDPRLLKPAIGVAVLVGCLADAPRRGDARRPKRAQHRVHHVHAPRHLARRHAGHQVAQPQA